MALPENLKINTGTAPNNGTGDPLRTAFQKSNAADEYLYQNKADIGDLQYYILLSEKGAAQGVATLDANQKLTASQLPNLAITDVIVATENTISGFAANSGNYTFQQGDVIIIDDGNGNLTHYIYKGGTKTDISEYSEISASEIDISQVNGLQDALDAKANNSEVIKGIRDSEGNLIAPNAQREVTLPEIPTDVDKTIGTLIELREYEGSTNEAVNVLGRGKKGDGLIAPFPFIWSETSEETDDDATIIAVDGVAVGRWKVDIQGAVFPEWFDSDLQKTFLYNKVRLLAKYPTTNGLLVDIENSDIRGYGWSETFVSGEDFLITGSVIDGSTVVSDDILTLSPPTGLFRNPILRDFAIINKGTGSGLVVNNQIYAKITNVLIACLRAGNFGIQLTNNAFVAYLSNVKVKDFLDTGILVDGEGSKHVINNCIVAATDNSAISGVEIRVNFVEVKGGQINVYHPNEDGLGIGTLFNNLDGFNRNGGVVQNVLTEEDIAIKITGTTHPFQGVKVDNYNLGNNCKKGIIFDRAWDCTFSNPQLHRFFNGVLAEWTENSERCEVVCDISAATKTIIVDPLAVGAMMRVTGKITLAERDSISTDPNITIIAEEVEGFGECRWNGEKWNFQSNYSIEDEMISVIEPKGARWKSLTSGTEGSLKVTLPVFYSDTRIYFKVVLFANSISETITLLIGGRNFSGDNSWANTSAQIISGSESADLPVRFGNDGSNTCIWIGNLDHNFSYYNAIVTEFTGSSGTVDKVWSKGWNISLVSTFDTVQETKNSNFPFSDGNKIKNLFDTSHYWTVNQEINEATQPEHPVNFGQFREYVNRSIRDISEDRILQIEDARRFLSLGGAVERTITLSDIFDAEEEFIGWNKGDEPINFVGDGVTIYGITEVIPEQAFQIKMLSTMEAVMWVSEVKTKRPVDGTYVDVTALIADQNNQEQDYFYEVTDASGLTAVSSGAAVLLYNASTPTGTESDYIIIWSEEDLDAITNITEIPNRSYNDLQDKIQSLDSDLEIVVIEGQTYISYNNNYAHALQDNNGDFILPESGFEDLYNTFYNFTGTSTRTWTLPVQSGNTNKIITIINIGTASLTVNANGGNNEIWDAGVLKNTITLAVSQLVEFYNNGQNWVIRNIR